MEFILELPPPDTGSPFPSVRGVSSLHHEVLDVAMDQVVIVIIASTQGKEVLRGGKEGGG